jgi:hypothetical protein
MSLILFPQCLVSGIYSQVYLYIYTHINKNKLQDVYWWVENNIKCVIYFNMMIKLFKHVYFYLYIGNMCHFCELKNVSWLLYA